MTTIISLREDVCFDVRKELMGKFIKIDVDDNSDDDDDDGDKDDDGGLG